MKHINLYTTLFSITQHIFSPPITTSSLFIHSFFSPFSYYRMPPIPPFLAFLRFPLSPNTPFSFFLLSHASYPSLSRFSSFLIIPNAPFAFFFSFPFFLVVPTAEPHFPHVLLHASSFVSFSFLFFSYPRTRLLFSPFSYPHMPIPLSRFSAPDYFPFFHLHFFSSIPERYYLQQFSFDFSCCVFPLFYATYRRRMHVQSHN